MATDATPTVDAKGRLLCGSKRRSETASDRTHCRQLAGARTDHPGVGKCWLHGGNSPTHLVHGARILTDMKLRQELAQFATPLEGDVDPQALLLQLIREAAGNVAYLGARVRELAETQDEAEGAFAQGSRWAQNTRYAKGAYLFGPKIDIDKDGGEHIVGEDQRGMVKLYGEWTDRLAKFCKDALAAGIAKAQVELAQQQGQTIVLIVNKALLALGLGEEQMDTVRTIIAQEFRQLESGVKAGGER